LHGWYRQYASPIYLLTTYIQIQEKLL